MRTTPTKCFLGIALAFVLCCFCIAIPTHAGRLVVAWGDNTYGQIHLPGGLSNVTAIAGGEYHSLALRTDGSVVGWGHNNLGQVNVPSSLANVKAIAAAGYRSMALKADGTVVVWGDGSYGQTNVPSGLKDVTAIAAGIRHNLALTAAGQVFAWGDNAAGQTNVPAGLSNVTAIAAGSFHSIALKADGTVVEWGNNSQGQSNPPPGLSNIVAIAAGFHFNVALKADGAIVTWGGNYYYSENYLPLGLTNITAISAGSYHAIALRSDGTAVGWGGNTYAQSALPSGLSGVTAIAAGGYHNLALILDGPVLVPDGRVQIVQNPQSQELAYTSNVTFSVVATGQETLHYQWYFKGSPMNPNNVRASGTTSTTLAITNLQFSDIGTYAAVVSNAFGSVISAGATLVVTSPPFITQQPVDRTVRAGSDVSLSVAASGTPPLLYQWNFNGTDTPGATNTSLWFPNAQPSVSGVYFLKVSNAYGVVQTAIVTLVVTDSPPYMVQQPYMRLPGQGTATNAVIPIGGNVTLYASARGSLPLSYQWRFDGVDIPNATNTTLVLTNLQFDQAGYYNVEVRNAFGAVNSAKFFLNVAQVLAWGNPFNGNTNMPAGLNNVIGVAAGGSHITALRADGTVRTWLANSGYVFDTPTAITNIQASATNIVAVAAGRAHSLALRSNGTVVAWGLNSYGQMNIPSGLSNVVAIGAGSYRSFAVRSNGTLVAWGAAEVPAGLSNVAAVAAGDFHNLALKRDGTVLTWGSTAADAPPNLTNAIAIAAGRSHALALKADGRVVGWSPYTSDSATNVPAHLSNVVAIAAAASFSMALKQDGTVAAWGSVPVFGPFPSGLSNLMAIAAGGVQSGFAVALAGNGSPALTVQPFHQYVERGRTVQLHVRAAGVQPMTYRWELQGGGVSGGTNASLTIPNVQGKDTGGYRAIVANALGTVTSVTAQVMLPFNPNLAAALNASNMLWTTTNLQGSAQSWFAQIRVTHDGDVAAQSGRIGHNQQSTLQTTVVGPGTLTFWWKVSSEEEYDRLWFSMDYLNWATWISGETEWRQFAFHVPAGSHVLRWAYTKDDTVNTGQDAGWVDEVGFTPASPLILGSPSVLPDGSLVFVSSDVGGRSLLPHNLAFIEIQASTNLRDWVTLSNVCTVTNGALMVRDPDSAHHPQRFYRIVEH